MGRAAVFVRFTGCNLWTGREEHRANAICKFCDTDFVGTDGFNGGFYTAEELAAVVHQQNPRERPGNMPPDAKRHWNPLVVFTGGEPMLQLDGRILEEVLKSGFNPCVETNGTISVPTSGPWQYLWVTVSPKAGTHWKQVIGDELKLVYLQKALTPVYATALIHQQGGKFAHWYLSPMDGPNLAEHTASAARYVQDDHRWKLNIQAHKYWELP